MGRRACSGCRVTVPATARFRYIGGRSRSGCGRQWGSALRGGRLLECCAGPKQATVGAGDHLRRSDLGRRPGNAEDAGGRGGGARAGARGRQRGVRRSRRGDQPALRGPARARHDPACPGAPCRGRLPHGRRLHARAGGQYRRLHRHLRSGRHRHDHRPLHGAGGFRADPVHHRPGAARQALQGGFPGGRYRDDRQAASPNGRSRCANRRWCRWCSSRRSTSCAPAVPARC